MTGDDHTLLLLVETTFEEVWVFRLTYRNPTDFFPGHFLNVENMFSGSKFTQGFESEKQSTFPRCRKPLYKRIPKDTDDPVSYLTFLKIHLSACNRVHMCLNHKMSYGRKRTVLQLSVFFPWVESSRQSVKLHQIDRQQSVESSTVSEVVSLVGYQ